MCMGYNPERFQEDKKYFSLLFLCAPPPAIYVDNLQCHKVHKDAVKQPAGLKSFSCTGWALLHKAWH